MNARGVARLSMLAVALGIGAAVAHPPVASADSSTDWLSSIDSVLGGAALPAPATTLDYQVSIDGYDLFPTAGNSATATSGTGDIAIAYGSGADAESEGGFGDYAFANSTGSFGAAAVAGDPTAGATGNNFDFAIASGNASAAFSGDEVGAPDTTGSSFDFADASGGSTSINELADDAFAGQNGSGDVASAVGQNIESISGGSADAADPANFDSASAIDNATTPAFLTTQASAGGGLGTMLGGSGDIAFVDDPSGTVGTVGSLADAGLGFNSDLAAAFGDGFNAAATGANDLFTILGLS